MNRAKRNNALSILILLLFNSACSLTPLSPRDTARSVGKGKVKIDANYAPVPALNTTYGLTENLDAGLDIENAQLLNVWSRYSLLNNGTGVSVAATGGAFTHAVTDTDGLYAGALLSYQGHGRLAISAGYRYSKVSYNPAEYNNSYDLLPIVNNREDLSATGQLSVSIAYRLKPHLQLTAGAVCQYQHMNQDEHIKSKICLPLLGLSFFSR